MRVDDFELNAIGGECARIADLPAALAIERRLVEDDGDRGLVTDLVECFDELILRNDADDRAVALVVS